MVLVLVAGLAGCASVKTSAPSRTATEQELISVAADRAAEGLAKSVRVNGRAYLDTVYFEAVDGKYAISTIRNALLRNGVRLIDERSRADCIIEVRAGALSIDEKDFLLGVPDPRTVRSPGSTALPLYRSNMRKGVAKFSAFTYDARTGALIDSTEAVYATSEKTSHEVVPGITWESK
ncbi:MAG TPA: DUF6655 family protein [Vineibacter sp.]|nr:DUF6655 family protein [Vineibacter sp.]